MNNKKWIFGLLGLIVILTGVVCIRSYSNYFYHKDELKIEQSIDKIIITSEFSYPPFYGTEIEVNQPDKIAEIISILNTSKVENKIPDTDLLVGSTIYTMQFYSDGMLIKQLVLENGNRLDKKFYTTIDDKLNEYLIN